MSQGVPKVGLGGAPLGNLFREMSEQTADAVLDRAWHRGVRMVDTAPHYGLGLSEERIGRWLERVPREDVTISTKVGRLLVPDPVAGPDDDAGFVVRRPYRRTFDFTADGVRRSLEQSLARLGVDRVDVVYVHDPDAVASSGGPPTGPAQKALTALARWREEGVVGAVGVGTNRPDGLDRLAADGLVDILMIAGRYSLLDGSAAREAFPAASAHGVRVVLAGVFASGLLARAWPSEDDHADYQRVDPERLALARRMARVCRDHGTQLPAAALHHALRHPAVDSVVLGMSSPDEVDADMDWAGAEPPEDLWPDLAPLLPALT